MESLKETTIIEIEDFGNKYKFKVNLFNIENGLNFFLNNIKENDISLEKIEILLKQAILLNEKEELNQQFSLSLAKTIFRNPLTIITLATKIMEFQSVFLQDFKI